MLHVKSNSEHIVGRLDRSSMDYRQCKADWDLATRLGYEHTVPMELPQLE